MDTTQNLLTLFLVRIVHLNVAFFSLQLSAPQPFKCAPKTQYQVTGFWDEDQLEENHQTAYSNQVGRVDIEGQYHSGSLCIYLP